MYDVDIFVDVSSHSPRASSRIYGCVLSCTSVCGNPITLEIFGKCEGTYHHCFLEALIAALKRMKKKSRICLHGPDQYVLNMIDHNLKTWSENSFMDHKGRPLKDGDTWRELWSVLSQHEYSTDHRSHEYSGWLMGELKRKAMDI